MIKEIERSLQAANLGFSISNDGNIIRAVTPPFTEERRKDYVKQIKNIGEDSKIAVRNARREGNDQLKQLEKDKLISQDEEKTAQEQVQKITDQHTGIVDELVAAKEKELMTL
jgi:ribosome recycling factor